MANCLIINGSPRAAGKSGRISSMLETELAERFEDANISVFNVADYEICGCRGCSHCELNESCVIADEMENLIFSLMQTDYLFVITPIFFSGVPSQFKAVLDRMQPLFWKRQDALAAGGPLPPKRPMNVYITGEGGGNDPHGYEPVLSTLRSSFALANFSVKDVQTFIGPFEEFDPSTVRIPGEL